MKHGVDISEHNGEVDFESLKENGIEFCIIRLGIGDDIESQDDKYFNRNILECERLEIPFGIYIFSYAVNGKEISSEIKHTLRQAEKCKNLKMFKLGIWFDQESDPNYSPKQKIINDDDLLNELTYKFCYGIEQEGYFVGIYANKYWFTNKINHDSLDRFAHWVAEWSDNCTYNKTWAIWQNTSNLIINGKRYDSNYLDDIYAEYFFKENEEIKETEFQT